jgi:hypothetical protein
MSVSPLFFLSLSQACSTLWRLHILLFLLSAWQASVVEDVVKEFLREHGFARTLKAFTAYSLAATVSSGAAPPKKGKGAAVPPAPLLDGTDPGVPKLDRMVRCLAAHRACA